MCVLLCVCAQFKFHSHVTSHPYESCLFVSFLFSLYSFVCVFLWTQEAKATLTKAKYARTASAQLSSSVDTALQQLAELENHTAQAQAQLNLEVTTTQPIINHTVQAQAQLNV